MNTSNTVQIAMDEPLKHREVPVSEWLAGVDRRLVARHQYVSQFDDAIAEKREAAASECRQEAARERDSQRDEQMYGRL